MRVLGIESSCDETAVAIVQDDGTILANVIRSQVEAHQPYGGVVPEIAARAHIEWMEPVLEQALKESSLTLNEVDAIAVTAGPGLIGGVIVGVMTEKALASIYQKPLIAVNHLEAHALTARLTHRVPYPYLLLLVSGGHFIYAVVEGVGRYRLLGKTLDDALGEAFDKCAKMMELPYPGGPYIERLAKEGNPLAFDFPCPMLGVKGCDVSFSGLKTAVRYAIRTLIGNGNPLTDKQKADIAASFQRAVVTILSQRSKSAIDMAREQGLACPTLVVAGGVAANQAIGVALREVAAQQAMAFIAPPPALCTDNAAMIAWVGVERYQAGLIDHLDVEPKARWPLA